MHCFAIVAEGLLGEALRVAAATSPFRPRVAVGMERDPLDIQSTGALHEFSGSVAGPNGAQIGEQRPVFGQSAQDRLNELVEADQRVFAGLLALVADHPLGPVDVLGPEKRDIGLRRADVPGQFVKCLPLRVGLGGEDLLVLIEGNGAPLPVPNRRPLTLWDNRRGQPAHVQGEIVDAAQIDIGRDFPQFHGPQQVLRARFDQGTVDDIGVCFVLGGNDPPPMGFALLEFQDFGEHIPPCARGRLGIGRHHVGAGHLEMHEGNRVGLVATVEQAGVVGLVLVPRDW